MNFFIKLVLFPLMFALMLTVIALSLASRILETLSRLLEIIGKSIIDFMQALADRVNCR